jgi:hypothetical protein
MKKIFLALMILCAPLSVALASGISYNETPVDSQGIAIDANYDIDLINGGQTVDYLTFQETCSTVTLTAIAGSTSTVNAVLDTIVTTVTYPSGFALLYSTAANFNSSNLLTGVTYYAIPSSTGYLKLATSKANVSLGTAIDISTGTNGGTFALTPVPIGTIGFYWAVSNDGINYYALSVASVTCTGDTAANSRIWDFGFTCYRYLRCVYQSGTFGAIKLKLSGYGKYLAR